MNVFSRALPILAFAGALFLAVTAASHSPSEHKDGTRKEGTHTEKPQMKDPHAGHEEAMKAQHERMANFKHAADMMADGIIHSHAKMVLEGAEQLDRSLTGHENDMPHKNRDRSGEFHRLYGELGKRTEHLKAAAKAGDLPKSAVAYGKILEVCSTCHRKFRD